ncbi:uncharacterized protein LOC115881273 [Sitophilus oryzae]|uniref:Uncharacterized protein LOC115881273 n=1 Tax=Sitophilus oryzae TaxID=7048 RepID=A0A6J2XU40_SITOR|nr:uncharacterized protein LOC115881273 [Sitophilus oryzae]
MYFLEKICRICIQTGVPLVDLNMVDFDSVRLSEKLQICTKMVIAQETISSEICEKCVNKLRVSYHFQEMCNKSSKLIQSYLEKLTGEYSCTEEGKIQKDLEHSELNVEIEQIPKSEIRNFGYIEENEEEISEICINKDNILQPGYSGNLQYETSGCKRKQRITKQQRCSLLKQLLTPGNKPKKERDKTNYIETSSTIYYDKGGLKNIIDFTKNYTFSFKLDKNSNIESTPLDKLTAFSTNFFQRDFNDFQTHILHVIQNRDKYENISAFSTDDESETSDSEANNGIEKEHTHFEEVIVEPDIKIKSELEFDDDEEEDKCPLDYLETSFEEEEEMKIKKEDCQSDQETESLSKKMDHYSTPHHSNYYHSPGIKNKILFHRSPHTFDLNTVDLQLGEPNFSLSQDSSHSVKLLDRLVSSYPLSSRKIFSPNNVRCRTRNNPYINPLLKDQFLFRSFKCELCNRYFKSQGYLKAHTSKVH